MMTTWGPLAVAFIEESTTGVRVVRDRPHDGEDCRGRRLVLAETAGTLLRMPDATPIHPGVRIGHVHLKVADLNRALDFYCGVLCLELTQRFGSEAAFLSAGGYHHHIGLNTWESLGGSPPPPGSTGLYNLAVLYPP